MREIVPNGTNIFTQSFTMKFAQDLSQGFEGRSSLDEEYNFDGFKISGFEDAFGAQKRYIKPSDKNLVFRLILSR
jgi:hypothetical protein